MKLLQANAFAIPLPPKSVDCAVTSPPYYSLRKYSGEQEFVFGGDKNCVHEFESHERYHGAPVGKSKTRWQHTDGGSPKTHPEQYEVGQAGTKRVSITAFCHKCNAWRGAYGLEPTLQMYIDHTVEWCREVWRVLRDDGTFWLNLGDSYAGGGRGGQTEEKLSPNWKPDYPDSIIPIGLKPKDLMGVPWRVALALQADGWYLRSDIIWHKSNPMPESVTDRPTKSHEYLFLLTKKPHYYYDADAIREGYSESRPWGKIGNVEKDYHGGALNNRFDYSGAGRNKRSVWTIATASYSGAHFATYPPALVEPCIKAGCPKDGIVFDPFSGSGTTLLVARKLGRRAIGLDISAEYLELAKERLGIKALEEWENGSKTVPELDYEGLTLFEGIK